MTNSDEVVPGFGDPGQYRQDLGARVPVIPTDLELVVVIPSKAA